MISIDGPCIAVRLGNVSGSDLVEYARMRFADLLAANPAPTWRNPAPTWRNPAPTWRNAAPTWHPLVTSADEIGIEIAAQRQAAVAYFNPPPAAASKIKPAMAGLGVTASGDHRFGRFNVAGF